MISEGTDSVDAIIYTRRVSRYLEKNIWEDLEAGTLEYAIIGKFLADLKKEFSGEDDETMKEFVQEFRRVARGSRYKGKLLVEKFKQGIDGVIRRKLMKTERPPKSIEQWYESAANLNRHWRESRREEERLRGRREIEA